MRAHTGGPEQGHAWGPLVLWQVTLSVFGFFYQISQYFRSQWLHLKFGCKATDSNYFILSRNTEALEFLFLPFVADNRHSENHIREPGPSPPHTPQETARGRRPAPKPLPLCHTSTASAEVRLICQVGSQCPKVPAVCSKSQNPHSTWCRRRVSNSQSKLCPHAPVPQQHTA